MTDLRRSIATGRLAYQRGERVRLGDLLSGLGESGGAMTTFLLAAPFVSPFSLGPLTAPASAVIFVVGFQMLKGRLDFPIPAKYLAVPLPASIFRFMRRVIARLSRWFRWHRIAILPENPQAERRDVLRISSVLGIFVGALLLAVPVPMLPLTNTFPALAIMAFSIAHLRRGPREMIWGIVLAVTSALIFAALGLTIFLLGAEGIAHLREYFGL